MYCCEALARLPDTKGLIVGGHPAESDLARMQHAAARLCIAERVQFTGMVEPGAVAGVSRDRARARAAEHGHAHFRAVHVAVETLRVPRRGTADRRVGSAGAARSRDG